MAVISREQLVDRIAELRTNLEQTKAQANAISGALADAEYWLSELDRSDEEPPEKVKKGKS